MFEHLLLVAFHERDHKLYLKKKRREKKKKTGTDLAVLTERARPGTTAVASRPSRVLAVLPPMGFPGSPGGRRMPVTRHCAMATLHACMATVKAGGGKREQGRTL